MKSYENEVEDMIQIINAHAMGYPKGQPIDSKVIDAMREVPRDQFVEFNPYSDAPQMIGFGQTISQPFIVAYMTDMLALNPLHKVLEIGMGSGYQAAVLSKLVAKVYTVERIEDLAIRTNKLFKELGYDTIQTKVGNGYKGWIEHAPYDRIIVTATANHIPQLLVDQLIEDGKMIIPVRKQSYEELILITKTGNTYTKKSLIGVRFVPLIDE